MPQGASAAPTDKRFGGQARASTSCASICASEVRNILGNSRSAGRRRRQSPSLASQRGVVLVALDERFSRPRAKSRDWRTRWRYGAARAGNNSSSSAPRAAVGQDRPRRHPAAERAAAHRSGRPTGTPVSARNGRSGRPASWRAKISGSMPCSPRSSRGRRRLRELLQALAQFDQRRRPSRHQRQPAGRGPGRTGRNARFTVLSRRCSAIGFSR